MLPPGHQMSPYCVLSLPRRAKSSSECRSKAALNADQRHSGAQRLSPTQGLSEKGSRSSRGLPDSGHNLFLIEETRLSTSDNAFSLKTVTCIHAYFHTDAYVVFHSGRQAGSLFHESRILCFPHLILAATAISIWGFL